MIKKSGHYALQCVFILLKAHEELANEDSPILLCREPDRETASQIRCTSGSSNSEQCKMQSSASQVGKGTHGLVIVRRLLADKENWLVPKTESDCVII